jgi:hypothetical protein
LNEKKIAKPRRKKEISETEVKPVAEKVAKPKKAATAKKTETIKSEAKDFVIDSAGKLKPARKTKKTPSELTAKTPVSDADDVPEMVAAAGSELAEAVHTIQETIETETPVIKPKTRKRTTAAKKTAAPSSESAVKKTASRAKKKAAETASLISETSTVTAETKTSTETEPAPRKEESPIFKELSEPKLPVLPQENRARLQIQSPTRIFFYWSVKHNPFETLHRAFAGRAADYQLTAKLVNLNTNTEEIFPVEAAGSHWFDVDANTRYRIELGFFAASRPFVRLMYSNTVETPRSAPSPNTDWSTDFTVSADQFAEVLDASGYAQDAFEIAFAGDDRETSDVATQNVFVQLGGKPDAENNLGELRSALLALASQASLESLRGQISRSIFAQLETMMRENAERLSAEKILAALNENFDLGDETEEFLSPVFGASAIHFPRSKPRFPKFSPISSRRWK